VGLREKLNLTKYSSWIFSNPSSSMPPLKTTMKIWWEDERRSEENSGDGGDLGGWVGPPTYC